jgi:hypothetical protein
MRMAEAVTRALESDDPGAMEACLDERERWLELAVSRSPSEVRAIRDLLLEQQRRLAAHVEAIRARVADELRGVREARARIEPNTGRPPQSRLVSRRT